MLFLSTSKRGLQKALYLLEGYCSRWKLSVNTRKTKVMIFNMRKFDNIKFMYNGEELEIADRYVYLGLTITPSGNFSKAIKDLSTKAASALYSLNSSLRSVSHNPKLTLKLFDSLVKPIALYGSEVWGAFHLKKKDSELLLNNIIDSQKKPFESLNTKACKQALKINKYASTLGSLAELGKVPLSINIIVSTIKYLYRILAADPQSLLSCAFQSQIKLSKNSGNTLTFPQVVTHLLSELGLEHTITIFKDLNMESSKPQIKELGKLVLEKCTKHFKTRTMTKINNLENNPDSKLALYAKIKTTYSYENYLDNIDSFTSILTKFRLSTHNLPIERGRYSRPKLERKDRVCKFCKTGIGDELHALFKCEHATLSDMRNKFLPKIKAIVTELHQLDNESSLLLILSGEYDSVATNLIKEWLSRCDLVHK